MRILITGAARAIGAATAAELTRAGHDVVATARDPAALQDLDVALRLALDVTDAGSVAAALEAAGELDAVVNNAAQNGKGPLESFPLDEMEAMFRTNAFGALRVVQPLLAAWRARGSGVIVNVSSIQGRVATPLDGAYAASKYALESLSETLHYELGHFGIRVVIVEPGYTAPGMKAADRRHGDRAYAQLWEEWGHTDRVVTGPAGRTPPPPWPWPSGRPSRTRRHRSACRWATMRPWSSGHARRWTTPRSRRRCGPCSAPPGSRPGGVRQWAFCRLRAAIDR